MTSYPAILAIFGKAYSQQLRKLGHRVINLLPPGKTAHDDDIGYDFFKTPSQDAQFIADCVGKYSPDCVLQFDSSSPMIHLGMESLTLPKIWYAIDSHIHRWHTYFAPVFDFIFFAQKNFEHSLTLYQKNASWLPLCFRSATEFHPWKSRLHSVSFVGNMNPALNPQRIKLFDELNTRGIKVNIAKGDYVPVYTHSNMVINQSVNRDLNNRFFEAPGCGALLLNDDIGPCMYDILEPDRDFFVYDSIDTLIDKIHWITHHPAEAETMAFSAYKKINGKHTIIRRSAEISSKVCELTAHPGGLTLKDLRYPAYSFFFCSQLAINKTVTDYFRKMAILYVNDLPNDPEGKSWALIIQAAHLLEHNQTDSAMTALSAITTIPQDAELTSLYYKCKILLLADKKDTVSARAALYEGLKRLPQDAWLNAAANAIDR